MSVELMPLGVSCNSACSYCYQEPIRDAGNTSIRGRYDIDLMIKNAMKVGSYLTMYGGEALLVPKEDLEKVFAASYERFSHGGVQTNGDLIDDDHIAMFKKYGVGVGVSIDGPGKLNSLRPARNNGDWIESTKRTMENLVRLREAGVSVSIISVLHKQNGIPERLDVFKRWALWLSSIGITHINMHNFESESALAKARFSLSEERTIEAMLDLAAWLEGHPAMYWYPFVTVKELLRVNSSKANCVWHHCDPLTTPAVQAVVADGSMTNCGRASKEGIPWVKPHVAGYERYISLYQTPQNLNGCNGCRFFMMCGGECPGTGYGLDGPDWRLRTDHCKLYMALFGFYEAQLLAEGITPLSLDDRRPKMEAIMIEMFRHGARPSSLKQLMDSTLNHAPDGGNAPHGDGHGDHTDQALVEDALLHGDQSHGDAPHGDQHGDSHGNQIAAVEITRWKEEKDDDYVA